LYHVIYRAEALILQSMLRSSFWQKKKIFNWPKSGPVETGPSGPVATPLSGPRVPVKLLIILTLTLTLGPPVPSVNLYNSN